MEQNIGFHIDIQKKNFIPPMLKNGLKVYQVFTKNPRAFKIEYIEENHATNVKKEIEKNNLKVFSHASYLLNMANPDKWDEKIENGFCELVNIHKLGGIGTVFHVGKHLKLSVEKGLEYMENYIVSVLTKLYESYPNHNVYYIIETSCGAGSELLHKIEDLGNFYKRFTSDKYINNHAVYNRVKLCVDTAHIFAAGWKLHTENGVQETCDLIEKHLGWENIVCIHLNDSAKLFHSCVDRHANIGSGFIGEDLKYFLKISLSKNIPHILETPHDGTPDYQVHHNEIKLIQEWIS